jgi:sulfite reductase alpha subunit-like flavoprotein
LLTGYFLIKNPISPFRNLDTGPLSGNNSLTAEDNIATAAEWTQTIKGGGNMGKVLIVYASQNGSTQRVAEKIKSEFEKAGLTADMLSRVLQEKSLLTIMTSSVLAAPLISCALHTRYWITWTL